VTFRFLPGYQIHLPRPLPLILVRVAAQYACISLLPFPRYNKFRAPVINLKFIFILPFPTSGKPSFLHYSGVSSKPLCYPTFPELLVDSCGSRAKDDATKEGGTAATDFLAMWRFFYRTSVFPTSCIPEASK